MKLLRKADMQTFKRSVDAGTEEQRKAVQAIIADVRERQDEAIFHYTKKFDGAILENLKITEEEITNAYQDMDDEMIAVLREAAENIRNFHEKQVRQSWFNAEESGTILGQKITPIDAVGVYVPGGTAAYPSSVFMNVIPAKAAGVNRIAMTTPPDENGNIPAGVLVAADIVGVDEIYKAGGAQAVAGLAYGTTSIPPVDKIVGPGNIFVALAKREVFGDVAIDMIAGPSEIVILADETARPAEVASDLLSQAEHDARSSSLLVTTSEVLAEGVQMELEKQLQSLPRQEVALKSIENYGAIILCESLSEAVDTVNEIAPEHLEIITEMPFDVLPSIKHAGAIFLGRYSSEPIGDYFAGPNHVLPTNGTARFSSPLNVDDFVKKSSIISYSRQAWEENHKKIARFARMEGLEAHARAVEKRKEDEQ
ncbi:histidinol dehydrogenase [Thalassobacillus pellis]|uniref:histidinol dehydrogenase n=1 Tax=Thalassobacillus pellis TaxID=748008 RepID=UPI0019614EA7|nr:histidinol dehydrogenase [Thalassobacillus pellis]MBM7551376.1 histidinol dehydrogenase [Thalassobacillus pellis]